jgi:hypothetical protein
MQRKRQEINFVFANEERRTASASSASQHYKKGNLKKQVRPKGKKNTKSTLDFNSSRQLDACFRF